MAKKPEDFKGKESDKEEIRGIVHLVGRDVKGTMPLARALRNIKGVGMRLAPIFSEIISHKLNVPLTTQIGRLSEEQVDELERIVKTPVEHGVPSYMTNRRKDRETGKDIHVVGDDLTFSVKQDIDLEKNIYTWRGYRHAYGQKVRGQGTRTSGRSGLTVGVARAKVKEAAAAAKKADTKGAGRAAAPAAGAAATPAAAAKK
jgi:small subunit ribosomal protein S13